MPNYHRRPSPRASSSVPSARRTITLSQRWSARHSSDTCEVASFVERIRASEQFIPELALVAEDSSGVIAHVMLSWVGVEGGSRTRILNLTPMSVRPDRQRIGVGARLIRDALGRAEEAGEPAVMVEGIPAYYPRFGFEQASALGFISPHPKIPDDAFMVKRLPGYSPDLAGRIVYPAAFDALGY